MVLLWIGWQKADVLARVGAGSNESDLVGEIKGSLETAKTDIDESL